MLGAERSAPLLCLCALLCAAPAKAQPTQEVLTLDQSMRLAMQNNPELLSAEQDVIIAQQRVKEASYLFLPQTGLFGAVSKSNIKYPMVLSPEFGSQFLQTSEYENFYTARMSLVQPIYTGGRNTNTLRMARASLKQARTRYETVKRETVLSLKIAFYKLSRAKFESDTIHRWLDAVRDGARKLANNPWEALEARALVSEMENDEAKARQQLTMLKLNYLQTLNRELDADVDISAEFKPDMIALDLNKAVTWAMELRPEVKSEVYKAEMDSIALNLAMSRRSPTVMLGANYDVNGSQFPLKSNNWATTLAIQFPLAYDFWTQITQRKAELRQGDLKRSGMQDKVRLEVRQYHNELMFWQDTVRRMQENKDSLEQAYSATAQKAPAASMSALRAAKVVQEADSRYLDSVENQLIARARLEWAVGHDLTP
ncbi:MAG: TolC family protein [Elusimicrobia bacterium]|nr:TolC family protein [Elusimicrobiota bacterium]